MTRTVRILMAAALLTTLDGWAHAGELVTSPVNCAGRSFTCLVSNVSDKVLQVTIEDAGGSPATVNVNPGGTGGSGASCSGNNFCRFSGVSKRSVRASY